MKTYTLTTETKTSRTTQAFDSLGALSQKMATQARDRSVVGFQVVAGAQVTNLTRAQAVAMDRART